MRKKIFNLTGSKRYSSLSAKVGILIIGWSYVNLILLFGLQNMRITGWSLIIFVFLTIIFIALSSKLLNKVVLPGLMAFPASVQWTLLLLAGALGAVLFLSTPFGLPDNDVLLTIFPSPFSDLLALITGLVTVTVAGGFLILVTLFVVVGTQPPLYPRFLIVAAFFVIYLLVGLVAYDDYGLSIDEPIQRNHGLVAMKYVFSTIGLETDVPQLNSVQDLETYRHKYYGVAMHLPLVAFEILNNVSDSETIWLFRHYSTFLFFFCGALAFYRLATEKYEHWQYGLIGTFLLVLTPRIFAESFYNIKDTTFLAAFCISLYFSFRYWRRKDISSAVLFGASVALAANIRIIALILIPIVMATILFDAIRERRYTNRRMWLGLVVSSTVFALLFIVIAPASWENPFSFLQETLQIFSNYTRWNGQIMYMGEFIRGRFAPWHYLPVWLLITLPLSNLFLFSIGVGVTLRDVIKHRLRFFKIKQREVGIFLFLFAAPIVAAIVLHSTLYSGWRQFTFIYAPFLMVALYGLKKLLELFRSLDWKKAGQRWALITIFFSLGIYQVHILHWIVANHPYQNVYFNSAVTLFGGRHKFERDYSRLAVRQSLEHILASDDRSSIKCWSSEGTDAIIRAQSILPPNSRARIEPARQLDSAVDYMIQTYRSLPYAYPLPEYSSIVVDNLPIMTVYTMDPARRTQQVSYGTNYYNYLGVYDMRVDAPNPPTTVFKVVELDGPQYEVFFQHPDSTAIWLWYLPPGAEAILKSALLVDVPEVYEADPGDGVIFVVQVRDHDKRVYELLRQHVMPRESGEDAIQVEVDLSAFSGQVFDLILRTEAYQTINYDWAYWISPEITPK